MGRGLVLNGRRYTIIGVAQPEFTGTVPIIGNFWTLLPGGPDAEGEKVGIAGRLSPGANKAQAEAELTALFAHSGSGSRPSPVWLEARGTFIPMNGVWVGVSTLLVACAGVVLLIGCANLANQSPAFAVTAATCGEFRS